MVNNNLVTVVIYRIDVNVMETSGHFFYQNINFYSL